MILNIPLVKLLLVNIQQLVKILVYKKYSTPQCCIIFCFDLTAHFQGLNSQRFQVRTCVSPLSQTPHHKTNLVAYPSVVLLENSRNNIFFLILILCFHSFFFIIMIDTELDTHFINVVFITCKNHSCRIYTSSTFLMNFIRHCSWRSQDRKGHIERFCLSHS